ncbi:TetR family transcriptional regulator C-terminal domain-containing protein [Streptomyces sp. NPDC006510]|uniref:TetR family transcriptional regulator C-terminal domain-containing protein n=1 Tax=Streptomyces sp. NPDC006510 TaxID=3155600 RepID=UPI0033A12266
MSPLGTRQAREREWLLVKTDFLVQAARNPTLAHVLSAHRGRLRQVVAERLRLQAERNPLPAALPDAESAAWAAVGVYDGVTVQLLLDGDTSGARARLARLLTALLADRAGAGTSADR